MRRDTVDERMKDDVMHKLLVWLLVLVFFGVVASTGCLGSDEGPEKGFGELRQEFFMLNPKPTVTNETITFIQATYAFDWNDYYALPENITAKAVLDKKEEHLCWIDLRRAFTFTNLDYRYLIHCDFRTKEEVNFIRLVIVADGVVVSNETVWESQEESR